MRTIAVILLSVILVFTGICQGGCNKPGAITEKQIEENLDWRMSYFIQLYGCKENLEKASGKTYNELKAEYRPIITEQLEAEQNARHSLK